MGKEKSPRKKGETPRDRRVTTPRPNLKVETLKDIGVEVKSGDSTKAVVDRIFKFLETRGSSSHIHHVQALKDTGGVASPNATASSNEGSMVFQGGVQSTDPTAKYYAPGDENRVEVGKSKARISEESGDVDKFERTMTTQGSLSDYEEIKPIGRGAYGEVVLVKNKKENDSLYVMKKVSLAHMSKDEVKNTMMEVDVLQNLNHQFIVKYKDCFHNGQTSFMVMEYCDGGDLSSCISKKAKADQLIDEDQILDWFTQMVMALDYIHSKKILHRDLKTQNIFLKADNSLRLGDFGIAKVLDATADLASTIIGTPYYMSPEVCQAQEYNAKSDVWALGCVLYELCARKHAFEGNSLLGLAWKIVQGTHPAIPKSYSEDLAELIDLLLQKDPAERPSLKQVLSLDLLYPIYLKYGGSPIAESDVLRTPKTASKRASIESSPEPVRGKIQKVPSGDLIGLEDVVEASTESAPSQVEKVPSAELLEFTMARSHIMDDASAASTVHTELSLGHDTVAMASEVTAVKNSPRKDPTPRKEASPRKEPTPRKETSPRKEPTPRKEASPRAAPASGLPATVARQDTDPNLNPFATRSKVANSPRDNESPAPKSAQKENIPDDGFAARPKLANSPREKTRVDFPLSPEPSPEPNVPGLDDTSLTPAQQLKLRKEMKQRARDEETRKLFEESRKTLAADNSQRRQMREANMQSQVSIGSQAEMNQALKTIKKNARVRDLRGPNSSYHLVQKRAPSAAGEASEVEEEKSVENEVADQGARAVTPPRGHIAKQRGRWGSRRPSTGHVNKLRERAAMMAKGCIVAIGREKFNRVKKLFSSLHQQGVSGELAARDKPESGQKITELLISIVGNENLHIAEQVEVVAYMEHNINQAEAEKE